jgi:hypothetical protein
MTVTAGMSANAQMVENVWTWAQICLKTVAFTKNGEMTPYPLKTPPIALMNYVGAKSCQANSQAANSFSRPPA